VLPKLFSTATQFLEQQSITTHRALLDKKVVLKRKKYFYLLLNITLQKTRSISHNEACDWCACFRLMLMTALTSTSMRVISRRKEIDNCSLFRNLVFIPPIAENPTSQMYEDEKGSSTFKASVERVGHVC
jgi:hypothetical protein